MPTVVQLNQVIADATGAPLPTVRMMARRLIDDDLLPKGSGRRVPKVTYEQATLLLLAVLAAQPVKDATRAALTYAGLTYNGYSSADATTALQAVSKLLRDIPKDVNALDWSLEICRSWPELVVHQPRPGPQNQTPTGSVMDTSRYIEPGKDPMHPPSEHVKEIALIPGICLYRIALALDADE